MVTGDDTFRASIGALESLKIEHRNYKLTKKHIASTCRAMLAGELLVLVGPSRVGKTRCIQDALSVPSANRPSADHRMRVVVVEAGNEATSGQFSTKDFAMACLKAIHHPVYGIPAEDDPWEKRLDELLDRTPERRLWSAFSKALKLRRTEYFVIDEAHHVLYVRGGDVTAARVLDSWKCLGNSTGVKIVLAGSYSLLSLVSLAPHLLGRQQPLDFPRYRADDRRDVEAWEQILRKYSELLPLPDRGSLSIWNRLLFEGSLGRLGGLALWLRTALARMDAEGSIHLDREILERTRLPSLHELSILNEIVEGERDLSRQSTWKATKRTEEDLDKPRTAKKQKRAFQRNSKRSPANGRV